MAQKGAAVAAIGITAAVAAAVVWLASGSSEDEPQGPPVQPRPGGGRAPAPSPAQPKPKPIVNVPLQGQRPEFTTDVPTQGGGTVDPSKLLQGTALEDWV